MPDILPSGSTLAMELSGPTRFHVAAAGTHTTTVKKGKGLILTDVVAASLPIVPGSLIKELELHEWKREIKVDDDICCLITICY